MKTPGTVLVFSCLAMLPAAAHAATYFVAKTGKNSNAGTMAAPYLTIAMGASKAQPGDTVYVMRGTYTESVNPPRSGTASAWITFSAYPGELPILDGGGSAATGLGSSSAQYIRVVGIASRNWGSGFGNGWVNDMGTSNGNWQFVNCIADGNGINGITFYNATGLLIDESIVAHNGNGDPNKSWSSGVNLFHVSGDSTTNVIRRTVSFENIDISAHHSDGSGFILDQNSSGALFENNIGFHNGGSCIRINCPGAVIVNNTCWHDGLAPGDAMGAPANPGEIYFSSGPQGAVMLNNLAAASGYNNTQSAFNATVGSNNYSVNANAATPFFTKPTGVDFTLVAGSTTVIDKGTTTDMPSTDIGFDPKCITSQTGQAVSWWSYGIDYAYIQSVGGIPGCFHPAARPVGAAPDIGAYEYGGMPAGGTGGMMMGTGGAGTGGMGTGGAGTGGMVMGTGGAGTGGAGTGGAGTGGAGTGGIRGTGGTIGTGGTGTGGTIGTGGMTGTGGTIGTGGMTGTGGTIGTGGATGTGGRIGTGGTGAGTGGTIGTGGMLGDGGTTGSGGSFGSGGMPGTGGGMGIAGAMGAGGVTDGGDAGDAMDARDATAIADAAMELPVAEGTGGAAGAGGTPSGSGGALGAGGSSAVDADTSPQSVNGGCACAVAGGSGGGSAALSVILGLALLSSRRRNRRTKTRHAS